jgi:hypothetical protein
MIGVNAISGGIYGFLLLLAVTGAAFGALGLGVYLWLRSHRRFALAIALPSLALLVGAVWVVLHIFPRDLPQLNLDLRQSVLSTLREPPFQCSQSAEDEWCSVGRNIERLHLILVDGQERKFKANNLYFIVNGGVAKKLAFFLDPIDKSDLLSLLDTERTSGIPVDSTISNPDEVRRAIEMDEITALDLQVSYRRGPHLIHLWIFRYSADRPFALWYEVFLDGGNPKEN